MMLYDFSQKSAKKSRGGGVKKTLKFCRKSAKLIRACAVVFIFSLMPFASHAACSVGYYARGSVCMACPANYPNSASGATSPNDCYLTTTAGKYVKTAGAAQENCPSGSYCPGGTKVYFSPYIFLDYITTSNDAVINTKLPLSATGYRIKTKMTPNTSTNMFGGYYGVINGVYQRYYVGIVAGSRFENAWFNAYPRYSTSVFVDGATHEYEVVFKNGTQTMSKDGVQVVSNGNTVDASKVATQYMIPAARNTTVYYMQWYNASSGVLLRNFIPAYDSNTNAYGMYDTVSNTFFGNGKNDSDIWASGGDRPSSGTGTITGPSINSVPVKTPATGGIQSCSDGQYQDATGQSSCKSCSALYTNNKTVEGYSTTTNLLGSFHSASPRTSSSNCSYTTGAGEEVYPAKTITLCYASEYCIGGTGVAFSGTGGWASCNSNYRADTNKGKSAASQCKTSCAAGTYVATANAACTSVGTGYYSAAHKVSYGNTSTILRNQCPADYRDIAASSQNECVGTFTKTGTQNNGPIPANCSAVTAWNDCTPGTCTYKKNFAGTVTQDCTATNCTKTPKTVSANVGYYVDGIMCTQCPAGYRNIAASSQGDCVGTFTKSGGMVEPALPAGCVSQTTATCTVPTCQYTKKYSGDVVSDCDDPGTCTKTITSVIADNDHYANGTSCPACPNGWRSPLGATDAGDCGRILAYQPNGASSPTQIYLRSGAKKTSPSLAALIDGHVFYANMTPVTTTTAGNMYVGYDNQTYIVGGDVDEMAPVFWVTTTPDTSSFTFIIAASGKFAVDWGDGVVETKTHDNTASVIYSHDYAAPGTYTIGIGGRATGYDVANMQTGEAPSTLIFMDSLNSTFDSTKNISAISGSLGNIFPTIGNGGDGKNPVYIATFAQMPNITGEIPMGIFGDLHGQPSTGMFASTFSGSAFTGQIPAGLFGNLSGTPAEGMFTATFGSDDEAACKLTGEIPIGLFGNLYGSPADLMFLYTFMNCTQLTGPTARLPNGTLLYDIVDPVTGKTWRELQEIEDAYFSYMYYNTQIDDAM